MIYFDNSATTRAFDEVIDIIADTMKNSFANSSALHKFGYEVEQKNLNYRKEIANILGVRENEIYFTSGGTESNNLAIFGTCEAYKKNGNKIITTKFEHPSVLNCFKKLEQDGYEVCYLDVDNKGYINIKNLIDEIDEKTILVSIMHVNNEIGTIQNINFIGEKIKQKNRNTIFHTDAVQSFGKISLNLKYIDLLSASGHKIHAQKGIGFLYAKNGVRIQNITFGAGQQNGLRSGTINNEGIAGLATASKIINKNLQSNYKKVSEVKKEVISIVNELEGTSINGDIENGIPYILSLSFKNIRGEVLVHSLEKQNIYVSTGSACGSKNKKKLTTIDYVAKENAGSTIRVSFCSENTIEEARQFKKALLDIVPKLRKYI